MARTQKMYLGDTLIGKQYLGSDLIIERGAIAEPSIVKDGLQMYLDADSPGALSSSIWEDIQGNFDGTVKAGVTYVTGSPSYYELNGTQVGADSNKIDMGTTLPTFMTGSSAGPYSIVVWVWQDTLNGDRGIFQFGEDATSGQELTLKTRGNDVGQLRIETGGAAAANLGTPYLTAGGWQQITVLCDGGGSTTIDAYYNTGSYSLGYTPTMDLPTTGAFQFGRQEDERWDGRLGVILLYNKKLSEAEITQNFNQLKDRFGVT